MAAPVLDQHGHSTASGGPSSATIAISTGAANTVVVVGASVGGTGTVNIPSLTIAGAGLTWHPLDTQGGAAGFGALGYSNTTQAWWAFAASQLTNQTITVTSSQVIDAAALAYTSFTGAASAVPIEPTSTRTSYQPTANTPNVNLSSFNANDTGVVIGGSNDGSTWAAASPATLIDGALNTGGARHTGVGICYQRFTTPQNNVTVGFSGTPLGWGLIGFMLTADAMTMPLLDKQGTAVAASGTTVTIPVTTGAPNALILVAAHVVVLASVNIFPNLSIAGGSLTWHVLAGASGAGKNQPFNGTTTIWWARPAAQLTNVSITITSDQTIDAAAAAYASFTGTYASSPIDPAGLASAYLPGFNPGPFTLPLVSFTNDTVGVVAGGSDLYSFGGASPPNTAIVAASEQGAHSTANIGIAYQPFNTAQYGGANVGFAGYGGPAGLVGAMITADAPPPPGAGFAKMNGSSAASFANPQGPPTHPGGFAASLWQNWIQGNAGANHIYMTTIDLLRNSYADTVYLEQQSVAQGGPSAYVVYDGGPFVLQAQGSGATAVTSSFGAVNIASMTPTLLYNGPHYVGYGATGAFSVQVDNGQTGSSWWYTNSASPPNPMGAGTLQNNALLIALGLKAYYTGGYGFCTNDANLGCKFLTPDNTKVTIFNNEFAFFSARSLISHTSLDSVTQYYAEVVVQGHVDNSYTLVGVISANVPLTVQQVFFQGAQEYSTAPQWAQYTDPTGTTWGAVRQTPGGVTFKDGDVISIAYDAAKGLVWFRKNGGSWTGNPAQGVGGTPPTGDPVGGTGGLSLGDGYQGWPIMVYVSSPIDTAFTLRDAANQFQYTPPTGYAPWSPVNLYRINADGAASVGFTSGTNVGAAEMDGTSTATFRGQMTGGFYSGAATMDGQANVSFMGRSGILVSAAAQMDGHAYMLATTGMLITNATETDIMLAGI